MLSEGDLLLFIYFPLKKEEFAVPRAGAAD